MSQVRQYFEVTYPKRLKELYETVIKCDPDTISSELSKFLFNTKLHLTPMKGTHADVVEFQDRVTLDYIAEYFKCLHAGITS